MKVSNLNLIIIGEIRHRSLSYWQVETFRSHQIGNKIIWDTTAYALRHPVTNMYLAIDDSGDDNNGLASVILVSERSDPRAMILFAPLDGNIADATDGSRVRLLSNVKKALLFSSTEPINGVGEVTWTIGQKKLDFLRGMIIENCNKEAVIFFKFIHRSPRGNKQSHVQVRRIQ